MTTMQKRGIAFAAVVAWVYFIGAFVSLEFDPTEWTREGQVWLALVAPLLAALLASCPLLDGDA